MAYAMQLPIYWGGRARAGAVNVGRRVDVELAREALAGRSSTP